MIAVKVFQVRGNRELRHASAIAWRLYTGAFKYKINVFIQGKVKKIMTRNWNSSTSL